MTGTDFLFILCSALAVACALLVVTRRNPVYSAGFLVLCFLPLAVLYFVLQAALVGVMQILVYMGAIMVLFVFVVMMINLRADELQEQKPLSYRVLAGLFTIFVALVLIAAIHQSFGGEAAKGQAEKPTAIESAAQLAVDRKEPEPGGIVSMGRAMFERWVVPFELVSVLILVALTGAVVLAKRDRPESGVPS